MKNVCSEIFKSVFVNRIKEIQLKWKTPWIKENEIEALWKGNADNLREAIDKAIEEGKWICPIKEVHGDDAYYSISKKEVVVPEREQFKLDDDFYAEVLHNMAHSTGNEEHLNRLKPVSFGSKQYAYEELVAELTAAYVCAYFGLEKRAKDDSLAYLKTWIESLECEVDLMSDDDSYICKLVSDVRIASLTILDYVALFK